MPRATAHLYDERFVGYGKDRVSWNYELAAKGAAEGAVARHLEFIDRLLVDKQELSKRCEGAHTLTLSLSLTLCVPQPSPKPAPNPKSTPRPKQV